jgi:TRAP-type C4-dicarboxylate transport system permease small subunit
MKILQRLIEVIIKAMAATAGVLLIFIMLAITYSVIMRAFFNTPVPWIMEISTYGLLYLTFLGAPWLLMQEGHVKVDLLLRKMAVKNQKIFDMITSITGFVICSTIFWYGIKVTLDNYQRNITVINMLATPKFILLAVIPLGGFFMMILFLQRIGQRIHPSTKI